MLRHPHKIHIGDNVVIDDNCCLDAKGTDNRGIVHRQWRVLGRNTILSCKNGDIVLDEQANIGFNARSSPRPRVHVGQGRLMAAYTYLVGGDHLFDRVDIPVLQQGRTARGIESARTSGWARTSSSPMDRTFGRDAIIGAGAVVVADIPDFYIATGVPAQVPSATGARRRRIRTDMCGIVGIIERDRERPVASDEVERMVRDAAASRTRRRGERDAARRRPGMRRLAIVDLAGGQQPFANETATSSSLPTARFTTSKSCSAI